MHQEKTEQPLKKDIVQNWVTSSRFLFHIQLFAFAALLFGGCYGLYSMRYKGKPKVEVPENTLYTPKYK